MSDLKIKEKQATKMNEPKSCFIITPIGEQNSEINLKAFGLIKAVIKPILLRYNYTPIAASEISSPGSINKQIIIRLYEDELVIANLTGLNPNVMYELAVRHAVKKPVIIMAERGTKLPFDLVDQRCIFYDDTLHGVEIAKDLLESFLSTALGESTVSNPIYDSINESQILQAVNSNLDDPSKYIIARLDKLESTLTNFANNLKKENPYNNFNYNTRHSTAEITIQLVSEIMDNDELANYVINKIQEIGMPVNAFIFKYDLLGITMTFPRKYLTALQSAILLENTIKLEVI